MLTRIIPTIGVAAVVLLRPAVADAQRCAPRWADDLWAGAPPGDVTVLKVQDGGAGPLLYIGTAGDDGANALSVWNGARLTHLGSVTGSMPGSSPTGAYALTVFDDGSGPALHVGGSFTAVNGVPAGGIAKWTGSAWESPGSGTDRGVRALAVYDPGSGPALYAGGFFTTAGGAAASHVARWDGRAWSPVGSGVSGGGVVPSVWTYPGVYALAAFDDGSGPALYAGGVFEYAGGAPAHSVARWDGASWGPVGNGLTWLDGQGLVSALAVCDTGLGPSLYAAGRVNFGTINTNPVLARWSGTSWYPAGLWLPGYYVTSVTTMDVAGTATLFASLYPYTSTLGTVFRLDGQQWSAIGNSADQPVRALAAFDPGPGPRLYAGGPFSDLGTGPVARLARWDAAQWSSLPGGGSTQPVTRLKTLDLGPGPALYALGTSGIGGVALPRVGRFDGHAWAPVGAAPPGPTVYDIEVFDDGTGPMLYAAGSDVRRLSGHAWEPVGPATASFTANWVRVLRTFDDGSGPKLYAGGSFPGGLRVWDGAAWAAPLGLAPLAWGLGVQDFEVFNDGTGPGLYMAWDDGLRRYTGSAWEVVPGPLTAGIVDLTLHDDGSGVALYAARASLENPVVKFDGSAWTMIASAAADGSPVAITTFDDGGGPGLFATGYFKGLGGAAAERLAVWRGGGWSAVTSGLSGPGLTLATFDGPSPSLWMGGEFLVAGGVSSGNIARWMGCPRPCHADCDGSGTLGPADFACFQAKFVRGDSYADCNADGRFTVADFGCFQTRFVVGCP